MVSGCSEVRLPPGGEREAGRGFGFGFGVVLTILSGFRLTSAFYAGSDGGHGPRHGLSGTVITSCGSVTRLSASPLGARLRGMLHGARHGLSALLTSSNGEAGRLRRTSLSARLRARMSALVSVVAVQAHTSAHDCGVARFAHQQPGGGLVTRPQVLSPGVWARLRRARGGGGHQTVLVTLVQSEGLFRGSRPGRHFCASMSAETWR
jgi:hypothetical protein